MRAELIKLHQRLARDVVYVTHDQAEAMTMGDRIVVMKDGVIQQVGTPTSIYERPSNRVRRELHRLAADELPAGDDRDGGEAGWAVTAAIRRSPAAAPACSGRRRA